MEEKDPCQRVLSISELVDHIFRFMSLKTVIACRQVNRQWLEVSDLYLKRRVCVNRAEQLIDGKQRQEPWTATAAITFSENPQGEELNVMDIEDVVYEIGPRLVVFALAKGAPATPLMKLVLQMEWMPAITTLELVLVFTFEEWILFRHQLLEKLDQLTSVDVAFRPGESRVSLPEEKTTNYLNVQRVEFNFAYIRAEGAHWMERVVKDVFQMFPSLVTLKAWHFDVATWLTRSNDERDVNAKVNEKWEFGFEVLNGTFNVNDAIWTHVATVFVKIAQLRKIYTNSADKVLSLLTTDDAYASQLEALTSFCHHHENDATPLLLTSNKFNNLKHLQWVYFPDQFCGSEVPESVESVVGNCALPNLEKVHLQRNYCQAIKQHEGLRLEKWILENLQKMAPNVKRLVASVFSPLVNGFPGGDWLKVLRIARSFVHLEQMFFINHQSPGSSQWTDLNMEEVVPCLGGLKSISLLVKDPAVLTGSAQFFVRAAARVRTIETLNLYRYGSGQEEEAAIFDLNLVEVAVPDHLLVSSGRWTKEVAEALEVVEEEVDH